MDENQPNQPNPQSQPDTPISDPAAVQVATPPTPPLDKSAVMALVDPPAPPTNEVQQSAGSNILATASAFFFGVLNWVIIPIIIVFILHNFVFQAFHVVGSSMKPTLHDTDYIIVSKVGKTISGFEHKPFIPDRYNIVVFHYPKDPSLIFVKRVIGLPGEHVVVKDNQVTIYNAQNPSGFSPDVSSFQRAADTTLGTFDDVVPQGSIFVLGDNRTPSGSFDSRDWGFLPSSYIVGTAAIRLLPIDQFRFFSIVQAEIPLLVHALI